MHTLKRSGTLKLTNVIKSPIHMDNINALTYGHSDNGSTSVSIPKTGP